MTQNLTGKWKGQYRYGEPYHEEVKEKSVVFYLDCKDQDGHLSGSIVDEIKELTDFPATIKGFVEDNFISFIKKYPCLWYVSEGGTITPIWNEPSQEIHYSGTFVEDHFEGEWEIITEDYVLTGTWSMSRF